MPSTHSGPRSLAVRIGAIAAGIAWVTVLFWYGFARPQDQEPPVTITPIESYDSEDLRRAADALEELRGTRLTPDERSAVGLAAEALDDLVNGDATIAPATTLPPPTTRPAPTTTTSTTTTSPPPTTTTPPRRTQDQMIEDLADQLGVELPDVTVDAGG